MATLPIRPNIVNTNNTVVNATNVLVESPQGGNNGSIFVPTKIAETNLAGDSLAFQTFTLDGSMLRNTIFGAEGFVYDGNTVSWLGLQEKVEAIQAITATDNIETLVINNTIRIQQGEAGSRIDSFLELSDESNKQRLGFANGGDINYGNKGDVLTSGGDVNSMSWQPPPLTSDYPPFYDLPLNQIPTTISQNIIFPCSQPSFPFISTISNNILLSAIGDIDKNGFKVELSALSTTILGSTNPPQPSLYQIGYVWQDAGFSTSYQTPYTPTAPTFGAVYPVVVLTQNLYAPNGFKYPSYGNYITPCAITNQRTKDFTIVTSGGNFNSYMFYYTFNTNISTTYTASDGLTDVTVSLPPSGYDRPIVLYSVTINPAYNMPLTQIVIINSTEVVIRFSYPTIGNPTINIIVLEG